MDEALDDCLVGAGGSQGVHGGEVWSHECWPETDGQVLTGHQVQLVVLTHPGEQKVVARVDVQMEYLTRPSSGSAC